MTINKLLTAGVYVAMTVALFSCGARRNPGRAYMPDMVYSRAYETYAPAQERLNNSGTEIAPQYNAIPVPGTIARGEMLPYNLKPDTASYRSLKNPLDLASINLKESERLYLVNCGICHGTKLDGNGPLYNDGKGPFVAAPKNLITTAYTEGTMFHVLTFGQGQMGSYASQLTTQQRWMIIAYIKTKQPGITKKDSTGAATANTVATDSSGIKKG